LEMRGNREASKIFFDKLLPAVYGRLRWKKWIVVKKPQEFCSATTEALTYLLLENSYKKWIEYVDVDRKDGRKQKTRWTDNARCARKYEGWDKEGIVRFNELVGLVKVDRKDRCNEETHYHENMDCGPRKKRKVRNVEKDFVTAADDFDFGEERGLDGVAMVRI
jgi:hypothetical protein